MGALGQARQPGGLASRASTGVLSTRYGAAARLGQDWSRLVYARSGTDETVRAINTSQVPPIV